MKTKRISITSSTWKRGIAVILAMLLLLGAAFSVETIPAVAASITGNLTRSDRISSYYYFWGDESRTYTYKYADGTAATVTVGGLAIHYIDGQVAYCIEPGVKSHHDITYSGTDGNTSSFWQNKLSKDQREAIGLILLYGAPNYTTSTDKDTEFGYEGATQVLIWEIIMGLRSPVAPFTRNSSQLYDTYVANAKEKFPSYITGYDKIAELIQSHKTIPSFAARVKENAPTVSLQYDPASGLYKTTITDANGVLANDFDFTAAGVTMTKTGNTLSISAPPDALAKGSVLASATGKSLDDGNLAYMVWTASGEQTVMTFTATAEPVKAYFRMEAEVIPGTATIQKIATDDVEGYCFKIYRWDSNTSWYGKTDVSGNVYQTDSSYSQSGAKVYGFSGLLDGEYTFLEALSQKGNGKVFPSAWRIVVKNTAGTAVYDETFTAEDFTTDQSGDCRLDKVSITGLNGGGTMIMEIHNAALFSDLEIIKTSEDGNVAGISFTVADDGGAVVGSGVTDANGKLVISGLETGKTYTVTETVPAGYVAEQESQTITIQEGLNTVAFHNRLLLGSIGVKKMDINDQPLAGVSFLLEYSTDGTAWSPVCFREEAASVEAGACTSPGLAEGVLVTGSDGTVLFRGLCLSVGGTAIAYRLTEVAAPEGYSLLTEPIFEGTLPVDNRRDIALTAVNAKTFVLPFTGGSGFTTVPLGIHLTVFALCTVVCLYQRKKPVIQ